MSTSLLNMLGGILGGIGQGKMRQAQREEKKELLDLQKQGLKLQQQLNQVKLADMKMKQSILNMISQQQQPQSSAGTTTSTEMEELNIAPTQTPPAFGKSFGAGLSDQLLNTMAMAGMPDEAKFFMQMGDTEKRSRQITDPNEAARLRVPVGTKIEFEVNPRSNQMMPYTINIVDMPKPQAQRFQEGGVTFERDVNPFTMESWGGGPRGSRVVEEKKALPGETAGKLGLVKSALRALEDFKGLVYKDDKKSIEWDSVTKAAVGRGGLPFTKGRQLKASILEALEAKIRIESGAAVPDSEIDRLMLRFMPSPLDYQAGAKNPDILAKRKIDRLEQYLHGTIELLDPNKHYSGEAERLKGADGKVYVWQPAPARGEIRETDIKVDYRYNPRTGKLEPAR